MSVNSSNSNHIPIDHNFMRDVQKKVYDAIDWSVGQKSLPKSRTLLQSIRGKEVINVEIIRIRDAVLFGLTSAEIGVMDQGKIKKLDDAIGEQLIRQAKIIARMGGALSKAVSKDENFMPYYLLSRLPEPQREAYIERVKGESLATIQRNISNILDQISLLSNFIELKEKEKVFPTAKIKLEIETEIRMIHSLVKGLDSIKDLTEKKAALKDIQGRQKRLNQMVEICPVSIQDEARAQATELFRSTLTMIDKHKAILQIEVLRHEIQDLLQSDKIEDHVQFSRLLAKGEVSVKSVLLEKHRELSKLKSKAAIRSEETFPRLQEISEAVDAVCAKKRVLLVLQDRVEILKKVDSGESLTIERLEKEVKAAEEEVKAAEDNFKAVFQKADQKKKIDEV